MRWLAGLFGFLAALLPATAIAGIIDPSRSTDWTQAGVLGGIPIRTTICATLNPGATATQITEAISACPSGQVVFLNAGTYNLSAGIVFDNKSNVTLRGAGPDQTFLIFTGGDHCAGFGGDICFTSGDPNDGFDGPSNIGTWTAGYSVGTTSITLGSITRGSIDHLQVGSVIFLDQLDDTSDPGDVYVCQTPNVCSMQAGSKNGRASRGQQEPQVVTSISGSGPWTVGISPGVRMPNISSGKSPEVWWLNGLPVQNDGVENLSMDHTGTGAAIAVSASVSHMRPPRALTVSSASADSSARFSSECHWSRSSLRTFSSVALRVIVPLITFKELWTVRAGGSGGSGRAGIDTMEAAL